MKADLIHTPNCFLPLARPCMGVVTIHDLAFEVFPEDFSGRTGWKYRTFTPRAARSAQRVICVSGYTAADVVRRYDVDEARVRIIPNAPSLPIGDVPVPDDGPVPAGRRRPAPEEEPAAARRGVRRAARRGPRAPPRARRASTAGRGERVREAAGGAPVELTG